MVLAKNYPRINPEIFRAYDIRGIYPQEFNEEASYRIGHALVIFLRKQLKSVKKLKIVVGQGCRLSSKKIFHSLTKGIREEGADVVDIGLVPTDALYFALNFWGFEAGVMISASHNPPDYNGLKMLIKGGKFIGQNFGMDEIKQIAIKNVFCSSKKIGKVQRKNVVPSYIKYILSKRDIGQFLPLKVVIDFGNGMASKVVLPLSRKLPVSLKTLYSVPDGRFPNHPPNPLEKRNIRQLCLTVKQKKADFGVAFDGDGDRAIFVDEKGNMIPSDLMLVLLAKNILLKNPDSKIAYSANCSKIVAEKILEFGGKPVKGRTGHTFMKELMRKSKAVFGGEISGHFYWRENFYAESGGLTLISVLDILSKEKKPLSFLIREFQKYFKTPEINLKVKNKEKTISLLEKKYSQGKKDYLDGLTVEFPDWWFNIRPSNTEPVIRLVIEAKNKKLLDKKKKEILAVIS